MKQPIVVKPPWRPWIMGVYGVFFGPLSAGLISYQNGRRLNAQHSVKKGKLLLGLGLLYAIMYWTVASQIKPEYVASFKYLFQAVAGATFVILQMNDFKKWQATTGAGASPSNGWTALGFGLVGLILFYATSMGLVYLSLMFQ